MKENTQNSALRLRMLYLISFTEGGVVMITELSGAKLLAPYFGSSLYSWASTLSVTLLALMGGYYFGGSLSERFSNNLSRVTLWLFNLSGLFIAAMPVVGKVVMQNTLSLNFFSGLLLSTFTLLFVPVFLLGTISPLIIAIITKKVEQAGRTAGTIYAVSTCGGILFTLLFGFLIIPVFGISAPLKLTGCLVLALGLSLMYYLHRSLKSKGALYLSTLVIVLFSLSVLSYSSPKQSVDEVVVLQQSEGLMGDLKVIDQANYDAQGRLVKTRKLRINNIPQTYAFADMPQQSLMYYVNFCNQLFRHLPKTKDALLIGLGAGSLFHVLKRHFLSVESVEIDPRIYQAGRNYFALPAHNNHAVDGRYFLNSTKKTYNLVMIDAIIGESVPAHLLTYETFTRIKSLLSDDGCLIIEAGGIGDISANRFVPVVYNTLRAAGFYVKMYNPLAPANQGDVLCVATKVPVDLDQKLIAADVLVRRGKLSEFEVERQKFDDATSEIFTDDKCDASLILKQHYYLVRQDARREMKKLSMLQ